MKRAPSVWISLGLTAALIAGCASTPPSTFYTLSSLPPAERSGPSSDAGLRIGLGPVSFPVFLDRPQLVSRLTDNRLEVDELNRWGGTIQDDFLRVLSENLGLLLGTSRIIVFPSEIRFPLDFRVAADVLAFEAMPDGQALLKIRWVALDGASDRVLVMREQSYRRPIQPPGDDNAMIAALSGALGAFSRDLAETLRALPRQPPIQESARPEA